MNEPTHIQYLLQHYLDDRVERDTLDSHRLKVCRHLLSCHTPVLGGIRYQCDHCHSQVPQYHSCRDRHCPQCQGRASRRWSERQQRDILPVNYYHLVFTLPHRLNGWVQLHPECLYAQLFQVVWNTLKRFAADPRRLDGKLGMTAVLHTWGQNLSQHVHLHCLIPGGVLKQNGQWQPSRGSYLFPVRALARHFRGTMVSALRHSANTHQLHRIGSTEVERCLDQLMQSDWVVYGKHCLNHTHSVVGYLARYSHKIAISERRIIDVNQGQVCFRYKDYRDNQDKVLALESSEFIRRFLMHVLPRGFMRIRHFGLLANRCRKGALERIRQCLEVSAEAVDEHNEQPLIQICPKCRKGHLIPTGVLSPVWQPVTLEPG